MASNVGWRVGIADMNKLNGIFLDLRQPVLLYRRGELAEFGRVSLLIEVAGVGTEARVEHEIVVAGPAERHRRGLVPRDVLPVGCEGGLIALVREGLATRQVAGPASHASRTCTVVQGHRDRLRR